MNMFSFLGETPTIALQNAQKECGSDAVVISTKKISSQGTNSENMYEITVALEDGVKVSKPMPKQKLLQSQLNVLNARVQQFEDDVTKCFVILYVRFRPHLYL
jgi:flagellar biosynthesis protein FlhF